jgi:hypothetical protein
MMADKSRGDVKPVKRSRCATASNASKPSCKDTCSPKMCAQASPLWVRSHRIERCDAGEGFASAGEYLYPRIDTPHPSRTSIRATFSHKGRRKGVAVRPIQPRFIAL